VASDYFGGGTTEERRIEGKKRVSEGRFFLSPWLFSGQYEEEGKGIWSMLKKPQNAVDVPPTRASRSHLNRTNIQEGEERAPGG